MKHEEMREVVHAVFLPKFQEMVALDWAIFIADKNGFHAFGLSGKQLLEDIADYAGTAAVHGFGEVSSLESVVEHQSVRLTPQEYQELITGKKP